jgi:hypothetical protein
MASNSQFINVVSEDNRDFAGVPIPGEYSGQSPLTQRRVEKEYEREVIIAGQKISGIQHYHPEKRFEVGQYKGEKIGMIIGDACELEADLEEAEKALERAQAIKANFGIESRKLGNLLDLMPAARAKVQRIRAEEENPQK